MTALATARMIDGARTIETLDAKLAANAVIYKGALCGFKAGYLVNWVSSDTGIKHPCIAIPELALVVDNTGGSAGDATCPVKFIKPKQLYRFANDDSPNNIAQANIGGDAWGKDDQTVSASSASGTRSRVGTPWLVTTTNTRGYPTGVYVEPEGPGADASLEDISALEFATATELTIASGAVTVTQALHTIDNESDAASDNFDTASGTVANQVYIFKPANAARTVVIRDVAVSTTGNIRTPFGQSISLAEATDWALGISDGTDLTIIAFRTLSQTGGGAGVLIGDLTTLTATDKTSAVAAINEVRVPVAQILVSRTASVGAKLTMAEGTDNGTNKVTIAAPNTLAGDVAVSLPTGDLDLADVPAMQAVDATLVSGTVTISSGIVVAATSEVIAFPKGVITGSTNFGCVRELIASRSVPGTVVIEAVGADGTKDADAAGAIRVVILTPAG